MMSLLFAISVLLFNLSTVHASPSTQAQPAFLSEPFPIVRLPYGLFRGVRNDTIGYNTFYGIRFASSPTGNLRCLRINRNP